MEDSYTSGTSSSSASSGSPFSTAGGAGLWTGEDTMLNPARGRKSLKLSKEDAPEFGSLKLTSKVVTANYLLTIKEHVLLCDCTAGNITVSLPPETAVNNIEFIIQKIDSSANKVIISGTINDQQNPELLHKYEDIKIKKCGTKWVRIGAAHNIRTFTGTPVGNLTPAFFGEDIVDPETYQWFKSYGLTNQDWVPLTVRNGMDIVLEPGSSDGKVLIKQPGTTKAQNKFFALWHDGVNALFKAFTGVFVFFNKIVIKDPSDLSKSGEIYQNGNDIYVDAPSGELRTNSPARVPEFFLSNGEGVFRAIQASGKLYLEVFNAAMSAGQEVILSGPWGWMNFPSMQILVDFLKIHGILEIDQLTILGIDGSAVVTTDGNKKLVTEGKNSAFNKGFGTGENDVSRGNHSHEGYGTTLSLENLRLSLKNGVTELASVDLPEPQNITGVTYIESEATPSVTLGTIWYKPSTGKVAIAASDGFVDLN